MADTEKPWEKYQRLAAPSAASEDSGTGLWSALKAGAKQGLTDIVFGGAQIGARMGPEIGDTSTAPQQSAGLTGRVDAAARQRERAYGADPAVRTHPLAAGVGRIGGNVAATAPLAMVPGGQSTLMGRAGAGAAMGAMGAAAQPVTGEDYWTGKSKQIAAGLVTGGALGAAGGMIGPALTPRMIEIAQNFKPLANMARGIEGRTIESFQRATGNQVLEPIGVTVPRTMKPGHSFINYVEDKISDAYNAILPRLTFRSDQQFVTEIRQAADNARTSLIPERGTQFTRNLQKWIADPIRRGGGVMGGDSFKVSERELGRLARSSFNSDPEFSRLLLEVQSSMRSALVRANPEEGPALQRANDAWAMWVRMAEAAGRHFDKQGEFSPADLQMAVRGTGRAARRQFAQGDRVMQGYAQAGADLVAGKDPAGIMTQFAVGLIGAGAGGMVGGLPGATLGAGIGELAVPLSQAAGRMGQTPFARGVGRFASGLAPGAGAATAPIGP